MTYVTRLHSAIQYFRAIGAWGMAQAFESILREELKRSGAKTLLAVVVVFLTACAKDSGDAMEQSPGHAPMIESKVYDACTYTVGMIRQPMFLCSETIWLAADHPEINTSYFAGAESLVTREDFRSVPSTCGPLHFPCMIFVQGPGPLAIPELGL